jgi:hypothetical protein
MDTKRLFPDVFAKAQNGFFPPEICFVAERSDETLPARLEDAPGWQVVQGPAEYKKPSAGAGCGNLTRLARPSGAG